MLVAAAVWVLAWLARRLSVLLIPVIVALFVASVLIPPMRWLRHRGLPDLAATWVVFLGVALVLGGVGLLIAPTVSEELRDLPSELGRGFEDVKDWLATGPMDLGEDRVEEFFAGAGDELRERLVTSGGARTAIEVLGGIFFGIVVAFFVTKDRDDLQDWFVRTLWHSDSDRAHRAIERGWATLRSYMGGVAIIGVVNAVLLGIALLVVGVPLVLPLMLVTFFGAFIPLVGAVVAGALAALVALAANGVTDALIIAGVVVVVQQIEGDVLAPAVLGRTMSLHPLAILVGVFAGGLIAGIFGAFVTVPLIATAVAARQELRA